MFPSSEWRAIPKMLPSRPRTDCGSWLLASSSWLQSQLEVTRGAAGCWNVALQRVIHHHAIGVEAPAQRADGAFHALDPSARKAVAITLIVERNHLFAKHSQQVVPIAGVVNIHVGVSSAASDGETVQPVVSLRPPAIQNREVQSAVQNNFLAARSGGFQRPPRIVKPHINPLR